MSENTKKGFDFARNSVYSADPMDLAIIGGERAAKIAKWPAEQRGPLDTDDGEEHDLWDPRLVTKVVTDEQVANIDAFGVLKPVLIVKIGDLACVVDGRGRVRRARAANARRKARGEPPIKVECKVARQKGAALIGPMIAANEVVDLDAVPDKIHKLQRALARGIGEEDAAVMFGVKVATIREWLAYEDNATAETKHAVESGQISSTAAAKVVARAKDPEKQRAVVKDLVEKSGGKKVSVTDARRAVATKTRSADSGDGIGVSTRRTQRKLLDELVRLGAEAKTADHEGHHGRTLEWWGGAVAALKLVLGEGQPVAALRDVLDSMGVE